MTRCDARRRLADRLGRDDGQVTVVLIGMAVIVLLLLAVVVSGSRVFLADRDLAAAADAAAASAAQAVSEPGIYAGEASTALPIDPAGARDRVAAYVAAAELPAHFDQFAVVDVSVSGATVSVTLAARAPMPYGELLRDEWADGYPITATATAQSPLS
jgi:Flp pilus assembly protein TadG